MNGANIPSTNLCSVHARVSLPQHHIPRPANLARFMQCNYEALKQEIKMNDREFRDFKTKIRNIARSTLDTDATYDEQAKDDQDAFMSQIKESINLAQFADAWPAEAYISRYLAKRASDLAYYELRTNAPRGRKTAFARVNASGVPAKKSPRFPGPCQKQHHSQIAPAGNNCPQENNSVAAFLRSVDPLLERFAGPLADSGLRTVDDLDRFAHNMTSFNRRKFLLDHLQPVPDDIEVDYINNALRKLMTGDDAHE